MKTDQGAGKGSNGLVTFGPGNTWKGTLNLVLTAGQLPMKLIVDASGTYAQSGDTLKLTYDQAKVTVPGGEAAPTEEEQRLLAGLEDSLRSDLNALPAPKIEWKDGRHFLLRHSDGSVDAYVRN